LYPAGASRPEASNLNYWGGIAQNMVEVTIASNNKVEIYNDLGVADFIFDIAGWITPITGNVTDGRMVAINPTRAFDSRSGTAIGPGETRMVQLTGGTTGVPAAAEAVVANLTVQGPTGDVSYLSIWPCD